MKTDTYCKAIGNHTITSEEKLKQNKSTGNTQSSNDTPKYDKQISSFLTQHA